MLLQILNVYVSIRIRITIIYQGDVLWEIVEAVIKALVLHGLVPVVTNIMSIKLS